MHSINFYRFQTSTFDCVNKEIIQLVEIIEKEFHVFVNIDLFSKCSIRVLMLNNKGGISFFEFSVD